jgi:HK97 family phage major capsid protein
MNVLEIKDAKANALSANDKIFELVEAEKRSMTPEETNTVEENLRSIKELDLRLESETRKSGFKGVEVKAPKVAKGEAFSLIDSINAVVKNKPMPEATRSLNKYAEIEFRNAGISSTGSIQVPLEVRADILAGTATQGQEIVAEQKMAILPPLTEKLVLSKAGATMLTGLVGNVSVPSYAGTTAAWATEVEAITETAGAFSEVNLSPKRLAAVLDVSKLFLNQDSVDAERMLYDNLAGAVARKLESTILGTDQVSATQPQGMGCAITKDTTYLATVAAPTYASIVALETAVDTSNALEGNLAYITNSAGRGILKNTLQSASGNGKYLLEDGELNGYPCLVTNNCSAAAGEDEEGNLLVFGNWKDLVIGQWGGYDITVDPYTVAHKGQVRLVINAYFDAKGLRGKIDSGSGYDEYAVSFAKAAIVAAE